MRAAALLLIALLILPAVSAWNTTIEIRERPYHVIDSLHINASSPCPQWVVMTLFGPEESRTASFFLNGTEKFCLENVSPRIIALGWKNVTVFLEARCPINISIQPVYDVDVCGREYYVSSWRYRIVRMPLKRERAAYEIQSPLEIEAIYFDSNRLYVNGTEVTELPLRAIITTENGSIAVEPRPLHSGLWWYQLGGFIRTKNLTVKLEGEGAEYIDEVYALALLPQKGFPSIPSYGEGYPPPSCGPVSYLRINGEALWEGENFTLFRYKTDDEKEGEIYVKNGFVCTKLNGGEACSGRLIPGPSHFEILFSYGTLYVMQRGRNFLTLELQSSGIYPELFLGLPSKRLYGMEIYARDPVPWKEKNKIWPAAAIGIILVLLGVLAVVVGRRR
ncbi:hypothetical protein GQS_00555 [Thermococcus sp. 4557]|uniref:hypothetical protein n=1 Tax=Thermococcus sp. (strain CGMCC 1.5172 / 4557) TaxID=1042877 RepID=UPI000219E8BB|nr:hypothetical protein [Thermococcus sp. 4557]AEK72014.1 hypothetical protein GQS_00555 [Thermococcus sp. 4557]